MATCSAPVTSAARRAGVGGRRVAGAQVPHHPRQIAVAAERHHERDLVAQRRPAGGDDRQTAGEADAEHADLAVRRQVRLRRQPLRRVLDDVGVRGRDPEPLQIRRRDGRAPRSRWRRDLRPCRPAASRRCRPCARRARAARPRDERRGPDRGVPAPARGASGSAADRLRVTALRAPGGDPSGRAVGQVGGARR